MAGASGGRGIPEAAVLSLAAGADLLCLGADNTVAEVREVQAAIVAAVAGGRLDEERLAEAAKAVSGLAGCRLTRWRCSPHDSQALAAGAARSVTVSGPAPAAGRRARGPGGLGRQHRDRRRAVGAARRPRRRTGRRPTCPTGRWCSRSATRTASPTCSPPWPPLRSGSVVVEWGWPGRRTDDLPTVDARGWSQPGAVAVGDVLRGAGW